MAPPQYLDRLSQQPTVEECLSKTKTALAASSARMSKAESAMRQCNVANHTMRQELAAQRGLLARLQ
jgi:tRNA A37 threonylcarbamoyladenosine synthetase subunit TsaC/SUA5/YrdC